MFETDNDNGPIVLTQNVNYMTGTTRDNDNGMTDKDDDIAFDDYMTGIYNDDADDMTGSDVHDNQILKTDHDIYDNMVYEITSSDDNDQKIIQNHTEPFIIDAVFTYVNGR